jgi:hypothetical protein
MHVPGFDSARPRARKVNLAEFDEVGIGRLQHVHDFSALIGDLFQRNYFHSVDHNAPP